MSAAPSCDGASYGAPADRRIQVDDDVRASQPLLPMGGSSSVNGSATPPIAAPHSTRQLLADILKLTGPIACTTVVEFLPQIVIAAMVGHADPRTALPNEDGDTTEGAVLTAYGLANLVYSTAAFSLVYGLVCGLDSVAASSYGMTMRDCATGEDTAVDVASDFIVAPPPAHGNNLPSRAIAWDSPALRGLYLTPKHLRCSSATGPASAVPSSRPSGERPRTPSRLPSDVPTVYLRRSPSDPTHNLSSHLPLPALSGSTLLASLEERSAFGAWKRRHDEGIDEPDTPEDEDQPEPIGVFDPVNGQPLGQLTHIVPHLPIQHHSRPRSPSRSACTTPRKEHHASDGERYAHFQYANYQTIEVAPDRAITPDMSPLDLSCSPSASQFLLNGDKPSWPISSSPKTVSLKSVSPKQADHNMPSSLIGIWIRRCLMLESIVVAILIVALYFGCAPLLRAMGEPAEAIDAASSYVIAASFGLPFVAIYHSLNKGLQSSGIVMPVLVISFVAKLFSCAAIYIGLYHLEMDLIGIAWILSLSVAAQSVAVVAYMQWAGLVRQWFGSGSGASSPTNCADDAPEPWYSRYWCDLSSFSALAIPACAAICLEFWLFDLLGALAGLLPNPSVELSVHYLLFTSTLASYMVFSGLSVSVSVLVGQKLGLAGQSRNAKQSAIVGTCACLCVSGLLILILIFFHREIGLCLTSQPLLLARFAECVPVLICYQLVDGLNTCSTQLLRTLGVQKHAVLLHFSCYYLVGMVLGYLLAFPFGRGVEGLWIGLCVGVGLNACLATSWLWVYADWEQQCQAAIERTNSMQSESSQPPRVSPSYQSTSDSSLNRTPDSRTTIACMRAENAAQHGV